MAKKAAKQTTPVDTTAGAKAYALAVQNRAQIEPRLPAGTIADLAAALTTLGAPPPASAPTAAPAPAAPSLTEALGTAESLLTALSAAIHATKPGASVRKAFGVGGKVPAREPKAIGAALKAIAAAAAANPSGALGLGILPDDVAAANKAAGDLAAAEAAAVAKGTRAGPTAKELRAAEARANEATARIGGAGVLAFAQNAALRAEFAGLLPKKKG